MCAVTVFVQVSIQDCVLGCILALVSFFHQELRAKFDPLGANVHYWHISQMASIFLSLFVFLFPSWSDSDLKAFAHSVPWNSLFKAFSWLARFCHSDLSANISLTSQFKVHAPTLVVHCSFFFNLYNTLSGILTIICSHTWCKLLRWGALSLVPGSMVASW